MKKNVTEFEFGRIIKEISACKFDCSITHIYLNNLSDDSINYLSDLARRLPAENLQSYMIHWNGNGNTENLLGFFRNSVDKIVDL